MKPLVIVGLILTILGVALLGWQGVAYFTTHEQVAQVGPFAVFAPVQHAVWLGPVVGVVVLAVGIILMLAGAARRT